MNDEYEGLNIQELKARAYDILAHQQRVANELQYVNNLIAQKEAKPVVKLTKENN